MRRLAAVVTAISTCIAIVLVLVSIDFSKLLPALKLLRPTTLAVVSVFLAANLGLAFFRFERTMSAFGVSIARRTTVRAFLLGTLAGQFLLSVIGQSFTRAMVLQSAGVPMSLTVVATYLERLVAFAVLGIATIFATLLLYGKLSFELHQGGAYLLSVGIGLSAVLGIAGISAISRIITLQQIRDFAPTIVRLIPSVLLSLFVFLTMFIAYFVIALDYAPGVDLWKLSAAIVIIMFAAGMPISWAGWGLREFGAVYALSEVGVSSESAVVIAITIGALSLIVTLAAAGGAAIEGWRHPTVAAARVARNVASTLQLNLSLFYAIGILTACLIYFQLRIPTSAGDLTVNIVDPLAITALFFAIYLAIKDSFLTHYPRWVLGGILALAMALVLGAVVAWLGLGLSQWALVNRLFGFTILIGYACVAGLVVHVAGDKGRLVLADTFVVSALLICGIEVVAYLIHLYVVPLPLDFFGYQFGAESQLEGFAQNANAFSFQLLMALSVLFAFHSPTLRRPASPWPMLGVIAILAVIVIGRSRAGIITGLVATLLTVFLAYMPSRMVINGRRITFVLVVAVVVGAIGYKFHAAITEFAVTQIGTRWRANAGVSDSLRWETTAAGIQMWLQNPVVGHGLGSFLLERERAGAPPLVIHSVPIWFLAEMGLVGLGAYALFTGSLLHWGMAGAERGMSRRGIIIAATPFILMGLVHDIFYQRTFWFAVGLILAGTTSLPQRPSAANAAAE